MAGSGLVSVKEYLPGRSRRARPAARGTRAALYLRVSTAEQKPDLQYDGLRGYAARAGLEVVQDYCDVAASGRKEGRPRLNALMAAARRREIDCVLVWKFDRFARSTRHLLAALARISRMTGIVLARIGEIWSYFQQLAAFSVVAPWNTQRVNQMTGLCGSISTAA